MVEFWRGLFILPLLFVYGNSQFLFPDFGNPLENGFKNGDAQAHQTGQVGAGDGGVPTDTLDAMKADDNTKLQQLDAPGGGVATTTAPTDAAGGVATTTAPTDAAGGVAAGETTVAPTGGAGVATTTAPTDAAGGVATGETAVAATDAGGVATGGTTAAPTDAGGVATGETAAAATGAGGVATGETAAAATNAGGVATGETAVGTADAGGVAAGETGMATTAVVPPTTFKGSWELFVENAGISAMHVVLLPLINQVLMFDATIWKQSYLKLPGPPCRKVEGTNEEDCFAHSILMDVDTGKVKALRVEHDTWCSSGALDINGRVVSTGGYNNGSDTVRILDICPTCDWQEYPDALANGRWYSTQVTLADGRFMVFGGRDFRTYEFVPQQGQKNTLKDVYDFKFLVETQDPFENNLYPFVFLSTDGNLYVFANNRSVLLNPNTHKIVHEFPVLPNGARNYPASGCAVLLPILLQPNENGKRKIRADVLICGGTTHESFFQSDRLRPKVFVPANRDCARLDITKRNGKWKISTMPTPRVIGDMAVLPTGDVLILNGAKTGSAGWDDAREPNFTPVLYRFKTDGTGTKFVELNPSNIPRMYHSTYVVLPDSKILVAGSNTNDGYIVQALYPTEVRVEKFSPHYLDPQLNQFRQEIVVEKSTAKVKYGAMFTVQIGEGGAIDQKKLQVTIYAPPFTTHGISMNQRLIQLAVHGFNNGQISLQAPLNGNIAPPGYYMLFVNYNGVPCKRAMWVQFTP